MAAYLLSAVQRVTRMFTSKPNTIPKTAPVVDRKRSVLAEDIVIEGNIVSQGILEFGGQIAGDLSADAVVLTSTARVSGWVRARQLTIEGELRGAATVRKVSIKNGACVKASLTYETLEVAPGAEVEGEYKRVCADTLEV
jgi:cytoskeletal protein CcmA (bactofilin family)